MMVHQALETVWILMKDREDDDLTYCEASHPGWGRGEAFAGVEEEETKASLMAIISGPKLHTVKRRLHSSFYNKIDRRSYMWYVLFSH